MVFKKLSKKEASLQLEGTIDVRKIQLSKSLILCRQLGILTLENNKISVAPAVDSSQAKIKKNFAYYSFQTAAHCGFEMFMPKATKLYKWVVEVKPKPKKLRYLKVDAVLISDAKLSWLSRSM